MASEEEEFPQQLLNAARGGCMQRLCLMLPERLALCLDSAAASGSDGTQYDTAAFDVSSNALLWTLLVWERLLVISSNTHFSATGRTGSSHNTVCSCIRLLTTAVLLQYTGATHCCHCNNKAFWWKLLGLLKIHKPAVVCVGREDH